MGRRTYSYNFAQLADFLLIIFLCISILIYTSLYIFKVAPELCWKIIPIIASVVAAVFIVEYTFLRTIQLNYNRDLEDLLEELNLLKARIDPQHFMTELFKCQFCLLNKGCCRQTWLSKSTSYGLSYGLYQRRSEISDHGISGYIVQYLPSKAYYKFMERGFYEEVRQKNGVFERRKLNEGRLKHLMHIYDYAIEFSQDSQEIEQRIHNLDCNSDLYDDDVVLLYGLIISKFFDLIPELRSSFDGFDLSNLIGLKLTISDLIIDRLIQIMEEMSLIRAYPEVNS